MHKDLHKYDLSTALILMYFSSLYSVNSVNILLDGFETLWQEGRICYGKHSIDALSNLKKKVIKYLIWNH